MSPWFAQCFVEMYFRNGALSVIEKLLHRKRHLAEHLYNRETALTVASAFGRLPVVKYLVEQLNVRVNGQETQGRYDVAVHKACISG